MAVHRRRPVKSNEPIDAQYVGCRVCLMVRIEKSLKRFYGYLSKIIDGRPQINWDSELPIPARIAVEKREGKMYLQP